MVSSKEKTPAEILEFCRRYSELDNRVPLVVVPSTYSGVTEEQLTNAGVHIVIYANHLLRSAYPSMVRAGEVDSRERARARGRRVLHADQRGAVAHSRAATSTMIEPQRFFDAPRPHGFDFFTGVPDSLLKDFCAYVTDHTHGRPARHRRQRGRRGRARGRALPRDRPARRSSTCRTPGRATRSTR